jgi:hypothetical protein
VLEPTVTVDLGYRAYGGVLKSYKGSETEKYVRRNGIAFEIIK